MGSQKVKEGTSLFIWHEVGKEPTEHILNELRERSQEFAALGSRVNLILKHKEDQADPTFAKTKAELPKAAGTMMKERKISMYWRAECMGTRISCR